MSTETPNLGSREKFRKFLKAAGPGLITGAADDDPSSIGTFSQAGSRFGLAFLWTALFTWPLMGFVQMACARIGLATGEGLASALRKKIPKWMLISVCIGLFVANTLNVGADLLAMADGMQMLKLGPAGIYVLVFGIGIAWATVRLKYSQIARVLKWLTLSLFAYIATAFIVGVDWSQAEHAVVSPSLPRSPDEWSMLVAILGTIIGPYLFFWQSGQEVEEKRALGHNTLEKRRGCSDEQIYLRRIDVGVGAFFSNVVMFFIILTTALTLHNHGLTNIETSKQAAEALRPIGGPYASLLYVLGMIGTGLLAIPTLTGSSAYAFAETFRWRQGLDFDLRKARSFYGVIIASSAIAIAGNFIGISPIKALYGSAVVNGIVAPFILLGLVLIVRDRKIMCDRPAPWLVQAVLAITCLLMFVALIGLIVF